MVMMKCNACGRDLYVAEGAPVTYCSCCGTKLVMPWSTAENDVATLLRRVAIFLESGEWARADEYCEKVLDIAPECAEAYLGKLMAECKVQNKEELKNSERVRRLSVNYENALRYADASLKAELLELRGKAEKRSAAHKKKGKIVALIASLSVVFLALLGYFGIYPFVAYQQGDYTVYINMYLFSLVVILVLES